MLETDTFSYTDVKQHFFSTPLENDAFSCADVKQKRIAKDGIYKISHVGIFVGVVEIDDEMYVVVRQSTKSLGGVVETIFSTEKMDSLGWNVWMWPKEVLPEGYDVRDIR